MSLNLSWGVMVWFSLPFTPVQDPGDDLFVRELRGLLQEELSTLSRLSSIAPEDRATIEKSLEETIEEVAKTRVRAIGDAYLIEPRTGVIPQHLFQALYEFLGPRLEESVLEEWSDDYRTRCDFLRDMNAFGFVSTLNLHLSLTSEQMEKLFEHFSAKWGYHWGVNGMTALWSGAMEIAYTFIPQEGLRAFLSDSQWDVHQQRMEPTKAVSDLAFQAAQDKDLREAHLSLIGNLVRERCSSFVDLESERLRTRCVLRPAQFEKLRLAGKGAIVGLVREKKEAVQALWRRFDQQEQDLSFDPSRRLFRHGAGMMLADGLWDRVLKAALDEEQLKAYHREQVHRLAFHQAAYMRIAVIAISRAVFLTGETRFELADFLKAQNEVPNFEFFDAVGAALTVSSERLDEEFPDTDWKDFDGFVKQLRNGFQGLAK